MGHKRTLLREQYQEPNPKIGRKGDRWRRCTALARGVRGMFEKIGYPKEVWERMKPGQMYEVRYHFTKGWRVRNAL